MKKFISLFIVVIMVSALFSCNENSGTTAGTETSISEKGESVSLETTGAVTAKPKTEKPEEIVTVNADAGSLDELEEVVMNDVEATIESLENEWNELNGSVNTYEKYVGSIDTVKAFYEKIYDTTEQLCVKLYQYSLQYAELIMNSSDDKYDDFDGLHDCIYEDAADEINDGIYEGILEDMNDAFYDGIIKDAKDSVEYSDWYDVYSDEYNMWYDTRSDVYNEWYDARSDVYEFYYDIRSDLWDDDIEKANKTIEDFRKDVEKLTSK